MINVRKLMYCLVPVALAAFALPASAADKLFTLATQAYDSSGTSTNGIIFGGSAPSMVLVDYFNRSPKTAASVINSVTATVPSDLTYKFAGAVTVNGGNAKCPASPPFAIPAGPDSSWTAASTTPLFQLGGLTGAKPTGHVCVYLGVVTSLPACQLVTWQGTANTGTNPGGGQPFMDYNNPLNAFAQANTDDGCDGTLACGATIGGVTRGPNLGTTTCDTGQTPVPYSFDFNPDPTGPGAAFIAIKGSQNPSVVYLLTWDPVNVDTTTGWTERRPMFSWGTVNHNPPLFPDDYIPALPCATTDILHPDLIMPVIPNIPPFSNPTTYAQYKPFLLDGITPQKAKMCVAEQGWTVLNGQLQYQDLVIDQSDGFTKLP